MFFETENICIEDISSVVKSDICGSYCGHNNGNSFHMLSLRIDSNTVFETEQEKFITAPGDIYFFPSFCGYSCSGSKDSLISVYFYSNSCLPCNIKKFTPRDSEYYNRNFMELYNCWIKKFVGYKHECLSILYKIITKIERDFSEITVSDIHEKMFEIIDHIHENFSNRSLTVASLAKKCYMSETYFRQLFTKTVGVTPLKYINNLKLNYAVELLKTSGVSISEAAYKAGFSNPNYFSTVIKKEFGMSPREYISHIAKDPIF